MSKKDVVVVVGPFAAEGGTIGTKNGSPGGPI